VPVGGLTVSVGDAAVPFALLLITGFVIACRLAVVLQETAELGQVWESVERATQAGPSWTCRRLALKRLHELLGEEAYFLGELPPAGPVWRFRMSDD